MTATSSSSFGRTAYCLVPVLFAVGLLHVISKSSPGDIPSSVETKKTTRASLNSTLLSWFEQEKGAKINFDIGFDADGERGAYAREDLPIRSTVFTAPLSSCIELQGETTAVQTFNLLVRMHKNMTFTGEYYQYFSNLPLTNSTFTSEMFTDKHIKLLNTPALEKLVIEQRNYAQAVYFGIGNCGVTQSLAQALGENTGNTSAIVPLTTFQHMTALLSSRYFEVHPNTNTVHSLEPPSKRTYLVPGGDLLNYDPNNINVEVLNDGKHLIMVTLRPVKKGEQLFFSYLPSVGHRNDMNLIMYGYLHKNVDSPLMMAVDLPTYNPENPFAATPPSDDLFYGPEGEYNTEDGLDRLKGLLDEVSVTDDDDDENVVKKDWRTNVLSEYRIQRKVALMRAIKAIEKELGVFDEEDDKSEL